MSTTNTHNTDTDNTKENDMTAPATDTTTESSDNAQSGDNAFVEKLAKRKPAKRKRRKTADTFQSVPETGYSGLTRRTSIVVPVELYDTMRRQSRESGVSMTHQIKRALEMYFENAGEPIVADM